MNRQDIANLALKITGLYCLIKTIEQLNGVIWTVWTFSQIVFTSRIAPGSLSVGTPWLPALLSLIPLAILAVLTYTLIAHSKKWAQRIFPDSESLTSPARILAVHALAYSIIGIMVIVGALPELAGRLVKMGFSTNRGGLSTNTLTIDAFSSMAGLITPFLKLALGLALFFGSHGLVRIWSRLRYSGLRRQLGLCVHCSYDLTGNTSGICPECGTPIAPKPPASCIQ